MEKDPDAIQKPNKYGWLASAQGRSLLFMSQSPAKCGQHLHVVGSLPRGSAKKKTKKLQFPLHLAISEPSRRMSSEVIELILNREPKVCKKQDS